MVMPRATALWLRVGRMVSDRRPEGRERAAATARPGDSMPSSLVSRMLVHRLASILAARRRPDRPAPRRQRCRAAGARRTAVVARSGQPSETGAKAEREARARLSIPTPPATPDVRRLRRLGGSLVVVSAVLLLARSVPTCGRCSSSRCSSARCSSSSSAAWLVASGWAPSSSSTTPAPPRRRRPGAQACSAWPLSAWPACVLGRVQRRPARACSGCSPPLRSPTASPASTTTAPSSTTCTTRSPRPTATAASSTLIMLDLDHFKQFNDRHGHEAGNELLRRVGATLQRHRSAKPTWRRATAARSSRCSSAATRRTATSSPSACAAPIEAHRARAARRRRGVCHGQRRGGHLPAGGARRDAAHRARRRARSTNPSGAAATA